MKPKRASWIPVVVGIMEKDGKVLLGQRPESGTLAGLWEFPGGKLELDETPQEALSRELKEELGIEAEVGKIFMCSSHSYGDKGILLLFFKIDYWKGEPRALHHSQLEWVPIESISKKKIPESNREILPYLF